MSSLNRRRFLAAAGGGLLGASLLRQPAFLLAQDAWGELSPCGPGAVYRPPVRAAFVRRKEEYGMLWPGAVYDGAQAKANYGRRLVTAADELGIDLALREEPLYSIEETGAWLEEAKAAKTDGLALIVLDRQQHAWPSAVKMVESGIPSVIFAPVGTAFTTNTESLAGREGAYVCSTNDFSRAVYGLRMIKAGARLREMRYLVIAGNEKKDTPLEFFGTKLRYLPAANFLEEYNRTPTSAEIRAMSTDFIRRAVTLHDATEQDVVNGVKSFVVARNILRREQGDGITMDCLGALGPSKVSLPCISWARMNDCGVPAACEADLGACVTHAIVQFLFERPGFQQDPVPETAAGCLIGSHCSCPTRLNGFNSPAEPYKITHHHGMRDASVVTEWKTGARATVADLILTGGKPEMVISAGTVTDNVAVPPSGGCVVAVMLKLDGVSEYLNYPGFHQLFFYGDYKRELADYCRLWGITAKVV